MSKKLTTEDVNAAILGSVRDLGYRSLKEEEKLVIANFLSGNDISWPYELAMTKTCVTFAF